MLRCIVATKANWRVMNHHVGQNSMKGYIKKVADMELADLPEKIRSEFMLTIGRWCSTIYILTLAGIPGLRKTVPAFGNEPTYPIDFDSDCQFQFQSFPAGTRKLLTALKGAKMLFRCRIVELCPNVTDFTDLISLREEVNANRARCHVNAIYLTAKRNENFSNNKAEEYLGRIGTYMLTLFPKSAVARLPALNNYGKVQGYDDYTFEWEATCIRYKRMKPDSHQIDYFISSRLEPGKEVNDKEIAALREAFSAMDAPTE